ncbi:MAG: glyoxalase [Labilithrix sp.]|nr:glyoxalase [Labilithrix sp.]
MTTRTSHKHGSFSWIELATTEPAKAKSFYSELFGWTYDDNPAGPDMVYSMAKVDGHYVAGLFGMGKETAAAMPPSWSSFVTVDDVDAAAKKVIANGGKVLKEPFDVFDAGRMAVVQDPAGGTLSLWQANKHIGSGVKNVPGSLCWNELYSTNADVARTFYTSTFGWQAEAVDMGPMGTYTLFKLPGETSNIGGMMPMPPNMAGVPSYWTPYIDVADCDASTKKLTELGGEVLMPPTDIPDIGRFSIVKDPLGAVFALYKNLH